MSKATPVPVLLLSIGCDIGLSAVSFECGPLEVPTADGCQTAGVTSAACESISSFDRGGCVSPDPCEGPGVRCDEVLCFDADPRDARFPVRPAGVFETPRFPIDPTEWDVLYVAVGEDGDVADGSIESPFSSIADAVAAAEPNGASDSATIVLLAEGTYREAVHIDRPVVLWGRCTTTTEIAGDAEGSALVFDGADNAGATGLTIAGGIEVRSSFVTLGRTRVTSGEETALRASNNSDVVVFDSTLETKRLAVDSMMSDSGIYRSRVEHGEGGVRAVGGTVKVEESVVRGAPSTNGIGVRLEAPPDTSASLTLLGSMIESSRDVGVEIVDTTATITNTIVRDVAEGRSRGLGGRDGWGGQGLRITGGSTQITSSLVERTRTAGIHAHGAAVTIVGTLIREVGVEMGSGRFGDGIAVYEGTRTSIQGSRVESTARAALASFGTTLTLGSSALGCSAEPLAVERFGNTEGHVFDQGDVVCGCGSSWGRCSPGSAGFEPWLRTSSDP